MEFKIKTTNELANSELIDVMKERTRVFVVEQDCPYQEVDSVDYDCLHVCLYDGNILKAYSRIYTEEGHVTFGRVLVVKEYRKQKLGRRLVQRTLEEIQDRYPGMDIQIEGQSYLKSFYQSFGFEIVSDEFEIDGIPHFEMRIEVK